jgi:hypothetical protein
MILTLCKVHHLPSTKFELLSVLVKQLLAVNMHAFHFQYQYKKKFEFLTNPDISQISQACPSVMSPLSSAASRNPTPGFWERCFALMRNIELKKTHSAITF